MDYPNQTHGPVGSVPINPQVQQWFSMADRDGNGRITSSELQRVLANGQGGMFSDKACRLMIGLFDREKKFSIDLYEFQALYDYVNSWLGIFRGFDQDNSGTIQEEELAAAFSQLGYRFSREFIHTVMERYDETQNGSITVDQFIVLCVQVQKFTNEFKQRDTELSGTITIGFEDFLSVIMRCEI